MVPQQNQRSNVLLFLGLCLHALPQRQLSPQDNAVTENLAPQSQPAPLYPPTPIEQHSSALLGVSVCPPRWHCPCIALLPSALPSLAHRILTLPSALSRILEDGYKVAGLQGSGVSSSRSPGAWSWWGGVGNGVDQQQLPNKQQ